MAKTICPKCSVRIKFPPELLGKKIRCPKCRTTVTLPSTDPNTVGMESIPVAKPWNSERVEMQKQEITTVMLEAIEVAWAHPILQPMIEGVPRGGARVAAALNAAGRIHAQIDAAPPESREKTAQIFLDVLRRAVAEARTKSRIGCRGCLLILAGLLIAFHYCPVICRIASTVYG